MSKGLKCPLCGSWYSDDRNQEIWFSAGDVCNNQSKSGLNPEKCSTDHPCPGILAPVDDLKNGGQKVDSK